MGNVLFIFNICLVPLILVYTGIYSYYNHYGVTKLRVNFIGNQITLEAVAFGFVIGMKIAAVLMILSCVFTVVSSDKIIYLLGAFHQSCLCSCPYCCEVFRGSRRVHAASEFPEAGLEKAVHRGMYLRGSGYLRTDFYPDHMDLGSFV